MINEKDCMQILNSGEETFTLEEVRMIRDLLLSLATIEYDQYKERI